jgi:predicted nucleotidyltransferase
VSSSFFAPVFAALDRSGTRYVIVGGVAGILHGYVRGTTDVDVVIDLDTARATRVLEELEAIGYRPSTPVGALEFADPAARERWINDKGMIVFSMYSSTNPVVVDLFVRSPMRFEDLYARSEVKTVNGDEVRVASLDDLISLKRAVGRPQDLVDIAELEAIRKVRSEGSPG